MKKYDDEGGAAAFTARNDSCESLLGEYLDE